MIRVLAPAGVLLALSLLASLALGSQTYGAATVLAALTAPDPESYDHFVITSQRLPRALIALYTGALMAMGGAVLQALSRNPLASPQMLGINAGAALFVVLGAVFFELPRAGSGALALVGGLAGFAGCLALARLASVSTNPRGLGLILSGAILSMLLSGAANALLLADPNLRSEFLNWLSGNINHVYADRLADLWWLGVGAGIVLLILARPLTLVSLGRDTAAAAGVAIWPVTLCGVAAVVIGASSAVAICGPVGFVGLVVPHMLRPFTGNMLTRLLPACACVGAGLCLWADIAARLAFRPFVLNTGVMMDLLGGIAFVWIVRRHYFTPRRAGAGA